MECSTNNVCVECTSELNDNATHFCDLTHTDTCPFGTSGSFYSTYAYTHSIIVPVMTLKVLDGDECSRDGCCANLMSKCINLKCVAGGGIFSNATYNTSQSRLCRLLNNYSLSTHYFDGVAFGAPASPYAENLAVNINNINLLLSGTAGSDIRPIRGNSSNALGGATYLPYWKRYRGSAVYSPRTEMFGYFYSNSTGDMYYVHQRDTSIISAKFSACLPTGLAYGAWNSTGAYAYQLGAVRLNYTTVSSFRCFSDDGTVAIAFGKSSFSSPYIITTWYAVTGFTSSTFEILSLIISVPPGLNDNVRMDYLKSAGGTGASSNLI
jgi:hypothetical protein